MKNVYNSQKHLFAFYHEDLSDEISHANNGSQIIIADPDLAHRIASVLRLEIGESMLLFDRINHALVTLKTFVKHKSITVILHEKHQNVIQKPSITFLLPVLKKESLETALYALTELGINQITLVFTNKSQQHFTQKEFERVQKIIIAAAEQSKNFAFPELLKPLYLQQVIEQMSETQKVFFDPAGILIKNFLLPTPSISFTLAIGPEGDLTPDEKDLMKKAGFNFVGLTPTILRSSQAAALGAGLIRALLR